VQPDAGFSEQFPKDERFGGSILQASALQKKRLPENRRCRSRFVGDYSRSSKHEHTQSPKSSGGH
jgi:hypothetical protein